MTKVEQKFQGDKVYLYNYECVIFFWLDSFV